MTKTKSVRAELKHHKKKGRKYGKRGGSGGSYALYVHRVLRQVAPPDAQISSKAMRVIDDIVHDTLARIADEAHRVARHGKGCTTTSRHVQVATRLLLPGELANHAVAEGIRALKAYNAS